ncbi:carbohydrate ABC transporter permease [Streptomyces iranensis]|uniref:ABC-type glycerol-3-phosphate transport system permease component n=1 Tax=Streptomyces iranensis TaxID=576784 RepID=A0A060ZHZ3_9ACTN|nr:carbohydrate ABC transporter permease [Streptomyces iranensis]MBP2068485.1 ABC-type glycerol-3-phosphate transport system permease component [Streptomyces iranensis]CDR01184.1 ABC-type transporter, integral membrane subunit [Streptomyces iranensis]
MNFARLSRPAKIVSYTGLTGLALVIVAPLLWLTMSVFKNSSDIVTNPFSLPKDFSFTNITDAWNAGDFGQLYVNSVLITVVSVFGILVLEGMAAYAFARMEFRGRNLLFVIFVAGQFVPAQIIALPSFLQMSHLNLADTRLSLILQYLSWAPFAVLFLRASFLAIPKEIEEAALLDGASRLAVLWRIILPMTRSSFATVGTIYALWIWNDFLFPLVYLRSSQNFTVPLGLAHFQGLFTTFWGYLIGAIFIAVWPPMLIYLLLSRRIQSKLAMGGVKG